MRGVRRLQIKTGELRAMRLERLLIFLTLILLPASPVAAQARTTVEVVPEKVMEAEFQSLDGAPPIRLSDHRGGVVVLALWASWCAPCRAAVGGLSEFNKEFAGRGVVVIGLTGEDPVKEAEAVQSFVGEIKPELRLGWLTKEAAEALMGKEKSVPQILVITGEGVIVTRFRGWSEHVPKFLRESAEKALTNPPARPQQN
jgi:thiol-disulfide isomerase/thioredoxin